MLIELLVLLVAGAARAAGAGEDRDHWAFQPIRSLEPPAVAAKDQALEGIDRFVLRNLEAAGLELAPEASRATLIRRLSYDLTGLPPTPEQIADFLDDRSPDAYEKLVDRLLASPHYGERQAQHWLDLARYADTDGFEFDQVRPEAYRYREWVVRAFNEDMPYDRFTALQIAGDELAPDEPRSHVATGFNRCYPDMVDLNDQGLRRQNALNDITETTGLVFLGLTLGCARCHDHKYDPITIADFYAWQAYFTPASFRDDYPIANDADRLRHEAELRDWQREVTRLRRELLVIEQEARQRLAPGLPPGLDDAASAAFARPDAERGDEEIRLVFEALARDKRVNPGDLAATLRPDDRQRREENHAALNRLLAARPVLPTARVLDEAKPDAPVTRILLRGDFASPGDEVSPAVPAVLSARVPSPAITPGATSSGRRRALADWLTRPENPLVARVIVNRIWQMHFGRGIVATSSDFGTMGDPPSHPDLLDWLASELVRDGWSLKAMHRRILTSAVYRQSSQAAARAAQDDPENRLLSHQNRVRLDGEAIRDALLAVSGRLNTTLHGPPVFPELPPELTRLSGKGAVWPVTADPVQRHRRSLYVFVRRNLRFPFFEAFDRPDTNASCPRRPVTTIAPQALSLLNGRLAHDAARGLAARVRAEAGPDHNAQVHRAFRLAFGRDPDAAELSRLTAFLAEDPEANLDRLSLALLNTNEFVYID